MRSRGRGGLLAALRSVAAQSWSRIEVIVVDTTGHPDSAWPTIDWRGDYAVRWLSTRQRLSDARAANMALDAVHGEYLCFLDDDGTFDPRHVEDLVRAAAHHRDALVVYGRSRIAGAGSTLIGRPLNRALFFHDQLFCLPAALIRRSIIAECRFDETLGLGAEHDFLEQVAVLGDFVFLAHAPPSCSCAPPDPPEARSARIAQRLYFDNLRFAKWTGERVHHGLRAALACARAERRLDGGDVDAARRAFDEVLIRYPGDPDALHGLARCELAAGRIDTAWQHIVEAIEFDPSQPQYRQTAERIRARLPGAAATTGTAAEPLRLRASESDLATAAPLQATLNLQAAETPRGAPCPCGSGRRYKHCCGRLVANTDPVGGVRDAIDAIDLIRRARELLEAGAATEAAGLLARVAPADVADARLALDTGLAYEQMQLLQPAFAWFERALELDGGGAESVAACDRCCHLMFRATAWQSASRSIATLLQQLDASAPALARAPGEVHIVCKLDTIGGTERRALNLCRSLAAHAHVTLWTTVPAADANCRATVPRLITPHEHPRGGTLVLVGTYFACGDWLETAPFDRVVICHNLVEQYPSLMERLLQIAENAARPRVDLTFPSRLLRDTLGLPGAVEYSSVDVESFRRRSAPPAHRARLAVGRHGRAYALKFHPNDPALFRALLARGYDVRILGGTPIAAAFAGDAVRPDLLEIDAEPPREFLESLDIFVYRKHPRFFETGGTAILEAMAMELPVVVFGEQCGVAELIRDGENGMLVDSEGEAIEAIDCLARDRELRLRLGRAARLTVVDLLRDQHERLPDFYTGRSAGVRDAAGARRRWFDWLRWPRASRDPLDSRTP